MALYKYVVVAFPTALCLCVSSETNAGDNSVAGILANVDKAIHNQNEYIEWTDLFRRAPSKVLESLMRQSNDTIAIAAAWESFVRRPASQNPKDKGRITKVGAGRFVAFCKGRLRIMFPCWYEDLLAQGIVRDRFVSILDSGIAKKAKVQLSSDLSTVQAKSVHINNGKVRLTGRSANVVLSTNRLSDKGGYVEGIAFCSIGERFWIVGYHELLDGARVICVDGGVELWRADVWTSIDYLGTSGSGYFNLCMVAKQDDTIFVYGIGATGLYIEGFDNRKGNVVVRFVSTTTGSGRESIIYQ